MPGWAQASATGDDLDSLGGRYQLITKLGSGGMCEVFLASARGPRSFHKLVVIKRMLSSTTRLQGSQRMFMDEAEITARFNHPNIVQTFEIVSDAEHLSIVMEFLEGQPLDRIFDLLEDEEVARSPLADPNVWVRVIADSLKGLHYAHELCDYDGVPLNIVHRDISPQNLFLTYDGVVKIVDFGIAKAALSSINTEVGTIKGKIGYMAPEQAQCEPVDRRTDIFSTGVVLWEFLSGKFLRNDDPLTELKRMASEQTPALSTAMKDVPSVLEAIVSKATALRPEDRYATAQEMRFALEGYLASQETKLTTADVGQAIALHFERDRQLLRERIRQVVSGTPPGGAKDRESAPFVPPSSLVTKVDVPRAGATPESAQGGGTFSQMQKSSRRRKVLASAVFLALPLVAAGVLWAVPRMTADSPAEAATMGAITIESVPSSATVRFDGLELGTTPLTTRAPIGAHQVTVSKAGFTEASSAVEAKGGETVKLSLSLAPLSLVPEAAVPEAAVTPEGAADVAAGDEKPASSTSKSPGQGTPQAQAAWRSRNAVPKSTAAPKSTTAPKSTALSKSPTASKAASAPQTTKQPSIEIIDESAEAKVKVDVIE
jgi:serine/threonine protein kinase